MVCDRLDKSILLWRRAAAYSLSLLFHAAISMPAVGFVIALNVPGSPGFLRNGTLIALLQMLISSFAIPRAAKWLTRIKYGIHTEVDIRSELIIKILKSRVCFSFLFEVTPHTVLYLMRLPVCVCTVVEGCGAALYVYSCQLLLSPWVHLNAARRCHACATAAAWSLNAIEAELGSGDVDFACTFNCSICL